MSAKPPLSAPNITRVRIDPVSLGVRLNAAAPEVAALHAARTKRRVVRSRRMLAMGRGVAAGPVAGAPAAAGAAAAVDPYRAALAALAASNKMQKPDTPVMLRMRYAAAFGRDKASVDDKVLCNMTGPPHTDVYQTPLWSLACAQICVWWMMVQRGYRCPTWTRPLSRLAFCETHRHLARDSLALAQLRHSLQHVWVPHERDGARPDHFGPCLVRFATVARAGKAEVGQWSAEIMASYAATGDRKEDRVTVRHLLVVADDAVSTLPTNVRTHNLSLPWLTEPNKITYAYRPYYDVYGLVEPLDASAESAAAAAPDEAKASDGKDAKMMDETEGPDGGKAVAAGEGGPGGLPPDPFAPLDYGTQQIVPQLPAAALGDAPYIELFQTNEFELYSDACSQWDPAEATVRWRDGDDVVTSERSKVMAGGVGDADRPVPLPRPFHMDVPTYVLLPLHLSIAIATELQASGMPPLLWSNIVARWFGFRPGDLLTVFGTGTALLRQVIDRAANDNVFVQIASVARAKWAIDNGRVPKDVGGAAGGGGDDDDDAPSASRSESPMSDSDSSVPASSSSSSTSSSSSSSAHVLSLGGTPMS